MSTHDPFLRHVLAVIDRIAVWSVLAVSLTALIWTAAWERGLGQPAVDGWRALLTALITYDVDRLTLTLLVLCIGCGTTTATLLGSWLFRRWRNSAQLDQVRLRGARWEGEQ